MRTLITFVIVLFCLQLWAQGYQQDSTIIDSVYAITELDGTIAATPVGIAFNMNDTMYELDIGDIGYPFENCSMRSFLSFPLPTIPNDFSLVNATIRIYQSRSYGIEQLADSTYVNTAYPHWDVAGGDTIKCITSHVNYGPSLDLWDWGKGDEDHPDTYSPNVGEITWVGINAPGIHGEAGYRYLDVTDCVLHDLVIGSIFSQYRIAFQINTDYDNGHDLVTFNSMECNNEYERPQMYYTIYSPSSVMDDISPAILANISSSPNPFSTQVTFDVSLKNGAELNLNLFDLRGREVKKQGPTPYSKGTHNISLDTGDLPSGIYLLQVKAGSETYTKKITCLK